MNRFLSEKIVGVVSHFSDRSFSDSESMREIIYAEIAKDLTKTPNDKIGNHLKEVMVV